MRVMSKYKKRVRNLFTDSWENYPISRSKIDLFVECPRCFYLDRKLGLGRPSMPGWTLNTAVDQLLKKEFDIYRERQERHPLMVEYDIDAVPFQHENLPVWRDDVYHFVGASIIDEKTGLKIQGIVDDIWVNPDNQLHIVDYKATSTTQLISLDDEYKSGYKRQMEIYQWIFRKMGFDVSATGYFVFANGIKNRDLFDNKLEFDLSILTHVGDDSWVGQTIEEIKNVLDREELPEPGENCEYCEYRRLIGEVE
jgi:CRISPR/Cas system-associated exonuclease Cas4 (RecB family)